MSSYFDVLNQLDVSNHIEKKGKFNYISWAWIQETLGKKHPDAIIRVKEFDNGLPVNYYPHDGGAYVWVTITINDIERGRPFPVLNNQNRPIPQPNAFDINTAIQRAFVKAASEHGIGLFVYAGEDLPVDAPPYTEEQKFEFDALLHGDSPLDFWLFTNSLDDKTKIALHNSFEKNHKTKNKNLAQKMETRGSEIFVASKQAMLEHIDNDDLSGLHEIGEDLGKVGKALAFKQLPPEYQHKAKILAQEAA